MKYAIQYEHLENELVKDEITKWHFNRVKDCANTYRLELSDEDFIRFLMLQKDNKDIEWMMHKMDTYKKSLIDVLVSYITYK